MSPSLKCQSYVLLQAQFVTFLFACTLFSEQGFFVETTDDSSDGCLLEQSIVLMLLISYGYKLSEILTHLWSLHVCAVIAGPSLCLQMWQCQTAQINNYYKLTVVNQCKTRRPFWPFFFIYLVNNWFFFTEICDALIKRTS